MLPSVKLLGIKNMNRTHAIFCAALFSWIGVILLWPRPFSQSESSSLVSQGSGLYGTSLTQANFGLLGVDFYESQAGKKRWKISSEFGELHRKENYAFMKQVSAVFFAEANQNEVYTKSDFGRSYLNRDAVELEGHIEIHSKQGYLFQMERLNYDTKKHEFTTNDLVHMRGPDAAEPTMYLDGIGLKGELDREYFFLKKDVVGRKRLKTMEWLNVKSKEGEFFTDRGQANFMGKVVSRSPTADIFSDRLEVINQDERELITAMGNVTLKNRNRTGKAQNAYIEMGSSKILLAGNAQISQPSEKSGRPNVLKGNRITLYTDDDRIEVEGAEGQVEQ